MIPEIILHKTSLMVASLLGWDFPPNRRNDLERGLLATARELGISDSPDAINNWLSVVTWNNRELALLSSNLTVGETYFFREKSGLDIFRNLIIPEIISDRQGKDQYLKIWCAGCCTGEEPYTLAILLHELIPDLRNWTITILGTDINPHFLKKAQTGIYGQWSFRETPQYIKNQYFIKAGVNREIIPEIKKMVTFTKLNLADDLYPSTLNNTHNTDVIFCRNVLMYFTPAQIRLVSGRFHQSLKEHGWLIVSAVERNDDYFSEFASVNLAQGMSYRKTPKTANISTSPHKNHKTGRVSTGGIPTSLKPPKRAPAITPKPISKKLVAEGKFDGSSGKDVQVLFEKGLYQECIDQCRLNLTNNYLDINLLTYLIRSYANMGNLADARKWGDQLLMQQGIGADAYFLIATILMENNEPGEAESTLKRSLYLDPHHLMTHFLMGNIRNRQNKNKAAAKHFQNVKELLSKFKESEVVPGSDGLTAGRMNEIVTKLLQP